MQYGFAVFLFLFAAVLITMGIGALLSARLSVRFYTLTSDKVSGELRLALLTDLHGCRYGESQRELTDALRENHPDAVLFAGDLFDDEMKHDNAETLVRSIAGIYPCFYVTGNHEYYSGKADERKAWLRAQGVTVLAGSRAEFETPAGRVAVCGADDPVSTGSPASAGTDGVRRQANKALQGADPQVYTVFLCHRPELAALYQTLPVDVVAAGHAHGGQWRFPGLINGIYAPNQGFFPKYAGGCYRLNNRTTLVVSRGLARESTRLPRVFNPPELVFITITPER